MTISPGGRAGCGQVSGEVRLVFQGEGLGRLSGTARGHGGYGEPVTFEVGSQIFLEKLFAPKANAGTTDAFVTLVACLKRAGTQPERSRWLACGGPTFHRYGPVWTKDISNSLSDMTGLDEYLSLETERWAPPS